MLERGTALGRFMVLGLVGRGAMGEVYGAYDPELDRKIAIKLLRARTDESVDNRTRLMREAQATAKISHPNVVVVYDAGTFANRVFIAMEFIEGHTLRFWLQVQPRTWHEILDAFLGAGRGLAAAHEKGLVHRDFKPDNVMVAGRGGEVRVMDFGLARLMVEAPELKLPAADLNATIELGGGFGAAPEPLSANAPTVAFRDKITATGAVLGTPAYMSPEQFRSHPADARSDQFSFCVALYEALYDRRPFAGRTLQELSENVIAGRIAPQAHGRVPAWVGAVLIRGLSPRPDDRFPSMNALLDELSRKMGLGRSSFAHGAAAKLAGTWEAPIEGRPAETPEKEAMRQAFLLTGKSYAAATFAGASAVLDRYAQRWSELYVEICEATHVRGEQSAEVLDLRMSCLGEGLDDLKALCRLFREPTAQVVENAIKAADALGTLERCQDVKLLRAVVRPPEDSASRQAVERLRQRLIDVRALLRVGKVVSGLEAMAPLTEEARRVGYGPLLAEVLLVGGSLQSESGRWDAAVVTLEEAFSEAELVRHHEVAVEAAILIIDARGFYLGNLEVAEVWMRYSETLLRRIGGHDLLWGWLFNNRGAVRLMQGRFVEAMEDFHRAVAAKERALGARAADVASSMANVGNCLAFDCDLLGALEVTQQALVILFETLGRDHPRTAFHLANAGQYLCRLGRYDDAQVIAGEALAVLERESDPRGLVLTVPLRTLGLCHLAKGRFEDAAVVLERAVEIREAVAANPLRLAEVYFPLARALYEGGADHARALALAARARREYARVATSPLVKRDVAELDAWLAARVPGVAPGRSRASASRPRRSPSLRRRTS